MIRPKSSGIQQGPEDVLAGSGHFELEMEKEFNSKSEVV